MEIILNNDSQGKAGGTIYIESLLHAKFRTKIFACLTSLGNSQHPCEISLILKTRLRLREVKHLDQDHTIRKQRSCDSN